MGREGEEQGGISACRGRQVSWRSTRRQPSFILAGVMVHRGPAVGAGRAEGGWRVATAGRGEGCTAVGRCRRSSQAGLCHHGWWATAAAARDSVATASTMPAVSVVVRLRCVLCATTSARMSFSRTGAGRR